MSQRFVTPSAYNSCLEQEYTYLFSCDEVGASFIHANVVRGQHQFQIVRIHVVQILRPLATRRARGWLPVRALVGLERCCLYDNRQGRCQRNNANKSSSGDGAHGMSKRFALMGGTRGSFYTRYTRVKQELYK